MTEASTTRPLHLVVAATDAGRPLAALVAAATGLGHEAALHLVARGGLWVAGVRQRDPAALAVNGAVVTIQLPPGGIYRDVIIDPGWLLYEDQYLLALDKPAGTYVDEAPWDAEGNLHVALRRFLVGRAATPAADLKLHPAHRLDRDTTGVLLFSKHPAANPALQRAFASGQAHKTYLALAAGVATFDQTVVTTGHGRSAHGRFRVYPLEEVGRVLPGGGRVKSMETRFEVLKRLADTTLLHAFPATGRTHQIRLHAAYLGHPLLGDTKYGGPAVWQGQPVAYHRLHAARLALPHPITGQPLVIEAPLPAWAVQLNGSGVLPGDRHPERTSRSPERSEGEGSWHPEA